MKLRHGLVLFMLFSFVSVNAQNSYKLEISKGAYSELSSATALTYSASDGGYYYATNFTFPVFNRTANFSQHLSPPSNGAFINPKGYVAVYESPGYANTIVAQVLYTTGSGWVDSFTQVSVKMEGGVGDRIMKFQWKNVVINNDTSQKLNFQLWLNEKDGSISYHYGPSVVKTPSLSSFVGLIVIEPNFSDLADAINLKGLAAAPQTVYHTSTLAGLESINDIPINGTIFTFKKAWPAGIGGKEIVANKSFSVSPNPVNDKIIISSNTDQEIHIYSITGLLIKSINITANKSETVDVSFMPAGCYVLKGIDGGVQKLQVVR